MDFFAQQDNARSKTGMLVVLFVLAVILVILAVYAAVMAVFLYNSADPSADFFDLRLFLVIAGVTSAVIGAGSLMKIAALSKGGGYVAESLGGKPVSRSTTDPDERKLLNVVEEMALASGTPVPPVYLLENEEGINAFAAGFSPGDAVIGVTGGCCRQLNREELQGVIAHEFSHILNGDMRLNIRLMGFLGGIMVIATIGNTILRGSRHRSYSSRKSDKGGGQILIVALLLLIIGYAGVLIGRLIQSAVSRQREYLADASAVQFTRSTGIADALKKIGGFASGSKVKSPAAGEVCHMFFGQAISSLFATHPPLIDRIQKIEPGFRGEFAAAVSAAAPAAAASADEWLSGFTAPGAGGGLSINADTVIKKVGTIAPENVAYSAAVLAAIPQAVQDETRDILGAWSVVCALLLDKDPAQREKQFQSLAESASPMLLRQLESVGERVRNLSPALRLPVLDTAVSALRQMSPEQFGLFKEHIRLLIEADNRITLFEFCLQEVIRHRLEAVFVDAAPGILYKSITPLTADAAALLSALARAGHRDAADAERAFRAGVAALPVRNESEAMPAKVSFKDLHTALERFARSSPGVKKAIFDACCRCVLFDGRASIQEAELLRAVAYAVDIPAPPFVMNA
ncbi:MAG: M48 family metallopeptidase [Thermodesulfobacteriota bacterium]